MVKSQPAGDKHAVEMHCGCTRDRNHHVLCPRGTMSVCSYCSTAAFQPWDAVRGRACIIMESSTKFLKVRDDWLQSDHFQDLHVLKRLNLYGTDINLSVIEC